MIIEAKRLVRTVPTEAYLQLSCLIAKNGRGLI
jgi:hypothetical protein